jgi:hypothetical protein
MTSTDETIARAFIKHSATTNGNELVQGDGIENAVTHWVSDREASLRERFVSEGNYALKDEIDNLRNADIKAVAWYVRYLTGDQSALESAADVPQSAWSQVRDKFGMKSTADDGIYSAGRS